MANSMIEGYTHKYNIVGRMAAEYCVRMLKGSYPRLDIREEVARSSRVLDAGCGDGRHIPVLESFGHEVSSFEFDEDIVSIASRKCEERGCKATIKVGSNAGIPYGNGVFDGALSWNQIYYLDGVNSFDRHVDELARVLKSGAWVVMSIPMHSAFIYQDSKVVEEGVVEIKNDYFGGTRNGVLMRRFSGEGEIESVFSRFFCDFSFGKQVDDAFGLAYHWHLIAMKKI